MVFVLDDRCTATGALGEIASWASDSTGLRVIIADVPGPLINGYFALATETLTDDGCPHTLEHLIFLGSDSYPYKGILDELANRLLCQGTNAWTDTDHTAYTLCTAGYVGFLALLPVYIDHILRPTLTDAGFVTEVHHITGEGQDAGVVYCEMQARENTGPSITRLELMRQCFPGSGYASETGGLCANLRSLTIDTIREYHRNYYRPENLCLVITGRVPHDELFSTLHSIEQSISSHFGDLEQRSNITRPWLTPVVPMASSIVREVSFPSPEEEMSHGSVDIGFHGPQWESHIEKLALTSLIKYLSESGVSPLQKALIECEPALCGSIDFSLIELSTTLIVLHFSDAPTGTLDQIESAFRATLTDHLKEFDIDRIRELLLKSQREYRMESESNPHELIANRAIQVFLYASRMAPATTHNSEGLSTHFADIATLQQLLTWPANRWTNLMQSQLLDSVSVTIIGRPCHLTAATMQSDEEARTRNQIESLGTSGLSQAHSMLQAAEAINDNPAPEHILHSFPIPDIAKVPTIPISTYSNQLQECNEDPCEMSVQVQKLPFAIQFDGIKTDFVCIRLSFDIFGLPITSRLLLELFCQLLFELPVRDLNGTLLSADDVMMGLDRDTVEYHAFIGSGRASFRVGLFPDLFSIEIKCQDTNYWLAVEWMTTLLAKSIFDVERIRIVATRTLSSISEMKRKGLSIVSAATSHLTFTAESTYNVTSIVQQETFLSSIVESITSNPQSVVASFEELQACLISGKLSSYLHVTLDFDKFSADDIISPLQNILAEIVSLTKPESSSPFPSHPAYTFVTPDASKDEEYPSQWIIGVPGIESSYLCANLPSAPTRFDNSDCAAILLVNEYFTALEGPFWKGIRGLGLSYSYNLDANFESGLVTFSLYRATNPVAAWTKAKEIIESHSSPSKFNSLAIDAAKASLSFSILSVRDTVWGAAQQSFRDRLKGVPPSHTTSMLLAIQRVTCAEMFAALNKYIAPVFVSSPLRRLVIVSGPANGIEMQTSFKNQLNIDLNLATTEKFFQSATSKN